MDGGGERARVEGQRCREGKEGKRGGKRAMGIGRMAEERGKVVVVEAGGNKGTYLRGGIAPHLQERRPPHQHATNPDATLH